MNVWGHETDDTYCNYCILNSEDACKTLCLSAVLCIVLFLAVTNSKHYRYGL